MHDVRILTFIISFNPNGVHESFDVHSANGKMQMFLFVGNSLNIFPFIAFNLFQKTENNYTIVFVLC